MARVLVLLAVLAAASAWEPAKAPPCSKIMEMIVPCIPYLIDKAAHPGPKCCSGVRDLRKATKTHDDLVAICKCLERAAHLFPGIDYPRADNLPHLCGVRFNLTFSPSVDCKK
ncbi:hypothetical protein C4D60_Mb02t19940 [Musa balbisiana]|uniref:Bifunctional inhibitor/plant lipid transfer protein/seed storage helical domain-containing protein n=1 Tax=Musa balbisiana TaxID=52838 RepID=A0A4S8IDB9_MUSBA|nr:hypothetical protein C4D60_Mb02t19940 [Musa balbisiana]